MFFAKFLSHRFKNAKVRTETSPQLNTTEAHGGQIVITFLFFTFFFFVFVFYFFVFVFNVLEHTDVINVSASMENELQEQQ